MAIQTQSAVVVNGGSDGILDFIDAHELKQARDSSLIVQFSVRLKDRADVFKKICALVGTEHLYP